MTKELTIKLDTGFNMFIAVEHPGFQYLGRVERGMEVGALALTPQGDYVQVNGSIVTPLNTSKVLATLRKVQGRQGAVAGQRLAPSPLPDYMPFMAPPAPVAPVPVIVKRKKRTLVMP